MKEQSKISSRTIFQSCCCLGTMMILCILQLVGVANGFSLTTTIAVPSSGGNHPVVVCHNTPATAVRTNRPFSFLPLHMIAHSRSSSSSSRRGGGSNNNNNNNNNDHRLSSKRQERVGQLVRTELSHILHSGIIRGRNVDYLDDVTRQRISVVAVNVSPDLRQARITVSIRGDPRPPTTVTSAPTTTTDDNNNDDENDTAAATATTTNDNNDASTTSSSLLSTNTALDKRRAYSWLVAHAKQIRHTLAQRMSHLKTCPTLTFVQVDVGAAVDVMYLIDKVAQGYKRESIEQEFDEDEEDGDDDDDEDDPYEDRPMTGVVGGVDFDQDIDEEEWIEDDKDFF